MSSSITINPRKTNNRNSIISVVYILIGAILFFIDRDATLMYFTVLPIQFMFIMYGIKSNNILLLVFFIEMFIAQGVNPVFFFLEKESYSSTGFNAIGNYNFSVSRYYLAYSYIFIFCFSIVVFDFLLFKKRRKKDLILLYLRTLTSKLQYYEQNKFIIYMVIFTVLMSILSIWMYSNGVGILGLKVVRLPFHLTGILVAFRRYIASIIMVYFFFKCKPKTIGYVILVIYGIIMSVSGCSKSIAAITFFPLIFYYFIEKQYGKTIFALVLYAFIYNIVSVSRVYTYEASEVIYSFSELIENSFNYMSNSNSNFIVNFLSSISGRFYGSSVLVLMDQQDVTTFNDLIKWYSTGTYSFSIIDMHGFSLEQEGFVDFAFGIGVGIPGFVVLLSCHNYMYTIIQSFIIIMLLHTFCSNVQKIIETRPNNIIILLTCGLLGLSTQDLWNAGPNIINFYFDLLGIIIIRMFVVKSHKRMGTTT